MIYEDSGPGEVFGVGMRQSRQSASIQEGEVNYNYDS